MLSEKDVALLMHEKSSPTARAEVAGKVAAMLAQDGLKPDELGLAQDIIRTMMRDVSIEVRQSLAENLKDAPQLPREVALSLAQDVESVALPILQFSAVLTDDDLILVVGKGDDAKMQAIARRDVVSTIVADALVDKGSEDTVAALVSNRGADLTESNMKKALTKFPESESVQGGMVHRERLPLLIAERLVSVVSDNLRDYLVSRHDLKPETVSDIIAQNRERAIISLSARAGDGQDMEKMLGQMHASGRLTPNLVLRALCLGDIGFFETAISIMAGVPLINTRLLIHDAGRLGLKSIYEKAGMPERMLPALRIVLEVLKETTYDGENGDRERFRKRVIERILTNSLDIAPADIDYLINKIESFGPVAA